MRRELSKLELQKITESVVINYLALHFNNEVRYTSAYKHDLKRDLNKVIKTLEKAEKKEFDMLFEIGDDVAGFIDGISGSIMDMINALIQDKPKVSLFLKSNILNAYVKDSKRMDGIADKILNK